MTLQKYLPNLEGDEVEDELFAKVQSAFQALGVRNTFVINGWQDNRKQKRSYCFQIQSDLVVRALLIRGFAYSRSKKVQSDSVVTNSVRYNQVDLCSKWSFGTKYFVISLQPRLLQPSIIFCTL